MGYARIKISSLIFTAILLLVHSKVAGQGTGIIQLEAPPGASIGWTFPLSRPSLLGSAALEAHAFMEVDISSGVWFLETRDNGPRLRSYETYEEPIWVSHGDINGDGWQDVVVAFRDRPVVRIFIGRENADPLIIEKQLPIDEGGIAGVADINGDGLNDLIMAGSDTITILVQQSNAANPPRQLVAVDYNTEKIFVEGFSIALGIMDVSKAIVDDFNGDSFPDILLSHFFPGIITLRPGSRTGILPAAVDTLFKDISTRPGYFLGPVDLEEDGNLEWLYWTSSKDSLIIKYSLGSYEERTTQVGLEKNMAGLAVSVGDYNNDGYPDFYVVNGSGLDALFRGNQDGTFSDVAGQAGVAAGSDGISCAWGDYDNDGYADLFVAGLLLPDKLFHNNGDGTFSDSSKYSNSTGKGREPPRSVGAM